MLMSVVHKSPTCATAMPLAPTLMVATTAVVSLGSLETASTVPVRILITTVTDILKYEVFFLHREFSL